MRRIRFRLFIIMSIVVKDLRDFSRDRLWMILTPVSLVFVIALFLILPDEVNETISVGIYPQSVAELFGVIASSGEDQSAGIRITAFSDSSSLISTVSGDVRLQDSQQVSVGLVFPADFPSGMLSGDSTVISIYTSESVPTNLRHAMISGLREIAYALKAISEGINPLSALPVTIPDTGSMILGEDMAGRQIPLREQMRPLLVIMILMIESLALAGLVSIEIQHRTVTALLVTPARTADLLAAKGLTGIILAVSQAVLFLLATGGFSLNWPLVFVLILLGSVMVSSVGMISGAAGKDFMGTLFYGMIFVVPLMIPAFSVLFQGTPPFSVRLLPSFDLVRAMSGVLGNGWGWRYASPYIIRTAIWDIFMLGTALFILKRRVESA